MHDITSPIWPIPREPFEIMPKLQENASQSTQASEDVILIDDSDDVDIDIGSETEVTAPKRKRELQGSSQTPMSTKTQKDTCNSEDKLEGETEEEVVEEVKQKKKKKKSKKTEPVVEG